MLMRKLTKQTYVVNGTKCYSLLDVGILLNVSPATAHKYVLKYGTTLNLPVKNDDEKRGGSGVPVAVTINGVRYPSCSAAAKALGRTPSGIHYHVKRKGTVFNLPNHTKPVVCIVDGKEYPSIAAGARALGISYSKLYRIVRGEI